MGLYMRVCRHSGTLPYFMDIFRLVGIQDDLYDFE
jgi:hypothetical protein